MRIATTRTLGLAVAAAVTLSACQSNPFARQDKSEAAASAQPAGQPASNQPAQSAAQKGAKPQAQAAAPAGKPAGNRREVKGINDWNGYIEGAPAAKSKFSALKIGMSTGEVTNLIGPPTDQRGHITGKAFIPFWHGSGGSEMWYAYKGVGRLLFAQANAYSGSYHLIGIEHDASERGYF